MYGAKKKYAILAILTVLAAPKIHAMQVRVVGNHAPPYRIIQGELFTGIYFEIAKELAKAMGWKLKFQEAPFRRALHMMCAGQADVIPGPNRTPEREICMYYMKTVFPREDKVFYVHPEAPPITRYEELKNRRIVVHRGKVYFDRFDSDRELTRDVVSSYLFGIMKVEQGRSDVIIMPEREGDYLLKVHGIHLKKSPYVVPGKPSYIAISRKSSLIALRKKIEGTMQKLEEEGVFTEILNRYR